MSKQRRILLVGGGSGGHLTPLLAVSRALKKAGDGEIFVSYVGQRKESLSEVMDCDSIDETHYIFAGKFRRYHGEGLISHILDVKTLLLNARDMVFFGIGIVQAWFLLGKIKPSAIFLKGGFVSVPVGIAARIRKIPYITHDSDAIPGLANRLTAKHASFNTTAMPTEGYPYKRSKAIQVGIPVQDEFGLVDSESQIRAKVKLGLNKTAKVLLITGGGNGSQNLNNMIIEIAGELLANDEKLEIVHITGKKLFTETSKSYKAKLSEKEIARVRLIDFTNEMFIYSSAADLIICRGGATNIAEFSAQAKACIFVPNPILTGGQQIENAKIIKKLDAGIIVNENDYEALLDSAMSLLNDENQRKGLGQALHSLYVANASDKIASILIELSGE